MFNFFVHLLNKHDLAVSTDRSCIVIGAGISGLSASAILAQKGLKVTLLEKNDAVGGRASTWKKDGFSFDMGPSFYWMPDVFDRFFARFSTKASDHYELKRLDPSYKVVFGKNDSWLLPAGREAVAELFEKEEPGAGQALHHFLDEARVKYAMGMQDIVYTPSLSWTEYLRPELLSGLMKTTVLSSLRKHVRKHFTSERIRQVMEFPVLFLGATPQTTPALYSLMNHADIDLGTWYPMGGMGQVMDAMRTVAEQEGAVVKTGMAVKRIVVENGKATGVETADGTLMADIVLATADYHHVEQDLLQPAERSYSTSSWEKRTMAPSTLLFYIGLDRRLPNAEHHMLFFDASLDEHGEDIYRYKRWPRKPLFYLSCTTVTDASTAPSGCENLVVLIPIASGSVDTTELREEYFNIVADRLVEHLGVDIREHLLVKRSYCVNDLKEDYNAFRGNAYGLASTIAQTGPLRPKVKSAKVDGLYLAGQLSVPGPGLPPALISGQIAADLILKELHSK